MSSSTKQTRGLISSFSTITLFACLALLAALLPGWHASADNAGYALSFDGLDDRVVLDSTSDLFGGSNWTSEKTVTLWVHPEGSSSPATSPESGQILVGNDRPHTFGVSRATFNGADRLWIWNADDNGLDVIGVDFQVGEWIQLALVHHSGMLSAYKNGELVGQIASNATYLPSASASGTLYIGGNSKGNTSAAFRGEIDEVRFWNTALSQTEIQNWMNRELDSGHPSYGDLAAYYQMSNGSGTLLGDDSGQGNDGSLLGGMGDQSWVASGAFLTTGNTPTPTPILPSQTPSGTPVPPSPTPESPTPTPTEVPPSPTATFTIEPPSATSTSATATGSATNSPPTFTFTPSATASPTPTDAPPTLTPSSVPSATASPTPSSTPTSSTTPVSSGAGYALDFDGNNDFVELPTTHSIFGDGWEDTMTVSLWVKPDSFAGACEHNHPAWCNNVLGDRPRWWGISIGEVVGLDRIWVWNYDGSATSPIDMIPIDYTPGEWVHVALVHSGGMLRAYRNGVQVGALPSGTTLQPNTGALPQVNMGGIINSSTRNWTFDGQIDEVRLWSTARSAEEIQADLFHPINKSSPNLAAYYMMSDGSGSILTDDTGHGNVGVLYDGARGVAPDGSPPQWVNSTAPLDNIAPTESPTETPTGTPTSGPSPTASQTSAPTSTPTATAVPPSPTPTEIAASATPSASPTITQTPTWTYTPSPSPTAGPGLMEIAVQNTSGSAYDLALAGNYAYVAATTGGLRVIDVSDPWNPIEVGSFPTATRAYGVDVDNGIAYLSASSSGVYVIDVSDPSSPTLLTTFQSGGFAWDVTVYGGYLFVADRSDGLHIIDISNPATPQQVGFIPSPDQTLDVAFYGTTMYVDQSLAGIQIVDISDPTNAQIVGSVATNQTYGVAVRDGHLFVADGGFGLRVFDINDPLAPTEVGSFITGGSTRSTWNEGPVTFIADWSTGIFAVDSANPGAITLLDNLDPPGRARDVLVRDGIVFLADYDGGLRLFTGP